MRIVKLRTLLLSFLLIAGAGAAHSSTLVRLPNGAPAQKNRDRVIATKTLTGTLKGFEVGDYVHAVLRLPNGKEKSFFIGGAGVDYFLAEHRKEEITVTYQIVDSYIEEAGGRMRIERISSVKAGGLTSDAWWKKMKAKYSTVQLDKMYGSKVESLRLNP